MILSKILLCLFYLLAIGKSIAPALPFAIDTGNAFPLTNDLKSIKFSVQEGLGNVWVVFSDNSIYRYDSNLVCENQYAPFSNRQVDQLTISEPLNEFWSISYYQGANLIKTRENVSARTVTAYDNSAKKLSVFDYSSMTLLETVAIPFPLISSNVASIRITPYGQLKIHQMVLNNSIRVST